MSLLRIHGSLLDPPQHCRWALLTGASEPVTGEGRLADLPRHAERVQLVIPAAQVLITRARVPPAARRRAAALLAFAVEEQIANDPEANHVSWLGTVGDQDVLAIVDKQGLARWRAALGAVGVHGYEVHCETLLLPWEAGEWSLAWNGSEGFVRTGALEGTATDTGDREMPPLSLRLMLEAADAHSTGPNSIAIYSTGAGSAPDVESWARELGMAVRHAGTWSWGSAPPEAGIALAQDREPWRGFTGMAAKLRPAAWILGAALVLHAFALVIDWTSLASEQRELRQQMDSRFRAAFPDAVAVVDPPLQMRRKLAEARHAAGQVDSGDFLPMAAQVTAAMEGLPAGTLRILSFENGRMTLELAGADQASVQRIVARLTQSGMSVESSRGADDPGGAKVLITVRVT